MREFTAMLRFPSGATEALTVKAADETQAREKLAAHHPGAFIVWIL